MNSIQPVNFYLSPKSTQDDLDAIERRRRVRAKSQRLRLPSQSSGILVKVAVEGLARESYVATLVSEALRGEGRGVKTYGHEDSTGEKKKTWAVGGGRGGSFDATELDAVMRSLLSYCIDDLKQQLWGTSDIAFQNLEEACDQRDGDTGRQCNTDVVRCPLSRLLLVLQTHIIAYWGNCNENAACIKAARELSLSHAMRLLEASLEIFRRLVKERDPLEVSSYDIHNSCKGQDRVEAMRGSFVALVPMLCASLATLSMKGEDFVSRAAILLPLVMPLTAAVDRFNYADSSSASVSDDDKNSASTLLGGEPVSRRWTIGLEEALAMLSSEIACGLTENQVPLSPGFSSRGVCDSGDGAQSGKNEKNLDMIEVLLTSSPFMAHGREIFDWSNVEDGDSSQSDRPDASCALKVKLSSGYNYRQIKTPAIRRPLPFFTYRSPK